MYPDDDEPEGLLSPAQISSSMSADDPTVSQGAEGFPKLPTVSEPVGVPTAVPVTDAEYQSGQESMAREQERAAKEAEAEQKRQETTNRAVETMRLREQGVKLTVDDQKQAVPATRPDGTMIYDAGWTGAPTFDPQKKSWLRERRDETGKVSPVDLYENGDIQLDDKTGDMILNDGGLRTVVGKNEDHVRVLAIKAEQDSLAEQRKREDLALAQEEAAWKPLEEELTAKERRYNEANTRMQNLQKFAAGTATVGEREKTARSLIDSSMPGEVEGKTEKDKSDLIGKPGFLNTPFGSQAFMKATEEFGAAQKEFLPLKNQKVALEEKKRALVESKIKSEQRNMELTRDRNVLEAARRRPEFFANTPAGPDEPADVAADRGAHGIGGDAYIPDPAKEDREFRSRMQALDAEAEKMTARGLGPDPDRDAKLADVNASRRAEVKAYSGRKAALAKYQAEDAALTGEIARSEGEFRAKQFLAGRRAGQIEEQFARGKMTPEAYEAQMQGIEKDLRGTEQRKADADSRRADLKKRTVRALSTNDEFPETLITRTGNDADLDPTAVTVRAAGRAAAFGTSQGQELYETLLEIKDGGKIQKVGGRPIGEVIREVGGQVGMKPKELFTPEEINVLSLGMRGPLEHIK